MIPQKPYIRIAYGTLELAMNNLQEYAEQQSQDVCIIKVEYGTSTRKVEYQYRHISEILDPGSNRIVAWSKPLEQDEPDRPKHEIIIDTGDSILLEYFIISQ